MGQPRPPCARFLAWFRQAAHTAARGLIPCSCPPAPGQLLGLLCPPGHGRCEVSRTSLSWLALMPPPTGSVSMADAAPSPASHVWGHVRSLPCDRLPPFIIKPPTKTTPKLKSPFESDLTMRCPPSHHSCTSHPSKFQKCPPIIDTIPKTQHLRQRPRNLKSKTCPQTMRSGREAAWAPLAGACCLVLCTWHTVSFVTADGAGATLGLPASRSLQAAGCRLQHGPSAGSGGLCLSRVGDAGPSTGSLGHFSPRVDVAENLYKHYAEQFIIHLIKLSF